MSQLRVPRVHIEIPGKTTRHRYEPRYYIPLFAAEWSGLLEDPTHRIQESAHPAYIRDPAYFWAEIESVDAEYSKCSKMFPRVFARVYPDPAAFYKVVEREMERGVGIEDAIARACMSDEEIPLEIPGWLTALKLPGLTEKHKHSLVLRGVATPTQVASMEVIKLAEVLGARLAKAFKKAIGEVEPSEVDTLLADRATAKAVPRPSVQE